MATIDDLSVRVSANTRDFTRGINSAQRQLSGLNSDALQTSAALAILQERTDEAEDEMSGLDRETSSTSRSLTTLAASAGGAAASFGILNSVTNTLTISLSGLASTSLLFLFPALIAGATGLVSALVPLVAVVGAATAGIAALAGAFGLVLGTGLVAFNERVRPLTEALSDLKEELTPIIVAFGDAFIPLIEDALEAIPAFVNDILNATGGLEPFANALRDFGQLAFEVLPDLVGVFSELARVTLPILRDFISFLQTNGGDALRGIQRIVQTLAPDFIALGRALVRALPEIAALGTAILQVALPALTRLVQFVEDVIQLGQGSTGFVDFIRTGIQRLAQWVSGPGVQILGSVVTTIVTTVGRLLSTLSQEDVARVVSGLIGVIGDALTALEGWVTGDGQNPIGGFVRTLFGGIAQALQNNATQIRNRIINPIITILAETFRGLAQAIFSDEAGQLVAALGQVGIAIGQAIAQGIVDYILSDTFRNDVLAAFNQVFTNLTIADALDKAGADTQANVIRGFSAAQTFDQRVQSLPRRERIGQVTQAPQQRVEVTVNGQLTTEDGEVVGLIDERTQEQLDRQRNRTRQQSGFNGDPR